MPWTRIQGCAASTRLLSDGVPLYFDHPGGLALLQIPPMDLDRVEVIKGSASALFGANATAGVVNLLSRRPGKEPNRELLFNQSTEDATDGVLWLASPAAGSWSRTLLVGAHKQNERDVDGDGWSDIAGYSRGAARQRVFWNNSRGRSASGTAGVTFEKRKAAARLRIRSSKPRPPTAPLGQMPLGRYIPTGAATLYAQSRVRDFTDMNTTGVRRPPSSSRSAASAPRQSWGAGVAVDWFTIRTPTPLAWAYVAPRGGIFVHDDLHVAPWLSVSGSARLDYSKGAGEALRVDNYFFSPRGSALIHGGPWSARVSAGRSYYTPAPLMEETEAAGFARLTIDKPLEVETARSISADFAHETRASTVTLTAFHSQIDHPALIDRATYTLRTETEPVVSRGVGSRHGAPGAVRGDRQVCIRRGPRGWWPRGRAHAPAQRRSGRDGGGRQPQPGQRAGRLHRRAAARRQPLSIDERALCAARPARGTPVPPLASLRQRRESDGCPSDTLGSDRAPDA